MLVLSLGTYVMYGSPVVNYDEAYALAWGGQLVHGHRPSFDVVLPPTPHPLTLASGAVLSLFGSAATTAEAVIAALSLGVLAYLAGRLGHRLAGPVAGVLAAILTLTRPEMVLYGSVAYLDIPFAALVLGAILLGTGARPRRTGVLICLGVAGLLRPEAWLLSAAYVVYPAIRDRRMPSLQECVLAALAPLLWLALDVVVSGQPLYSLTTTTSQARLIGRQVSLSALPVTTLHLIGRVARPEVVVGAVIGVAVCWRRRRAVGSLLIPGGVATLATAAVAALGAPLPERSLFVAAALGCVFCAAAIAEVFRPGPSAKLVGGLTLVVVLAASAASDVDRLEGDRSIIHDQGAALASLRTVVDRAVANGCSTVIAPSRLAPWLSVWLQRPPTSFLQRDERAEATRRDTAVILPAGDPAAYTLARANGDDLPRAGRLPKVSWTSGGSWIVRASCGPAADRSVPASVGAPLGRVLVSG